MNLNEKYNQETINAINDFIEDFMNIFPGLLSRCELLKRIIINLDYDIDFNATLEERVSGQFINNKMSISKDRKEKRQILFHEFIHVITSCSFVKNFEYHNFIEGLVTLAEEKYVQYNKIDMKNRKHVNGYIPTFVRQFNFVKDGELLKDFLVDSSKIYKLFYPEVMKFDCPFGHEDKDYKKCFEKVARKNEIIVYMANNKFNDDILSNQISEIETDVLKQYHIGVHLGRIKFDSKKFLELYNIQLKPKLSEYLEVLKCLYAEDIITYDDILNCGKLGLFYKINESDEFNLDKLNFVVDELDDNELNWIASKLFGFYNIVFDHNSLIGEFALDNLEMDIDKLFREQEEYEDRFPIYRDLVREILRGELDLENIKNCFIRRSGVGGETVNMAEYLLDTPKTAEDRLLEMIFGNSSVRIPTYVLEDSDGIKMIYNNELFYYPVDIVSIGNFIDKSISTNKDLLKRFFNGVSDQCIFVSGDLEFDFNYSNIYPFKVYLFDGALLNEVEVLNKDSGMDCNFRKVTFVEDGRRLFEKGTKEKFKVKDE